jgi:hypothetical protein
VGKKNDLLSVVVSNNIINRVKYLVKYLSYKVFSQVMYRHVISISYTARIGYSLF